METNDRKLVAQSHSKYLTNVSQMPSSDAGPGETEAEKDTDRSCSQETFTPRGREEITVTRHTSWQYAPCENLASGQREVLVMGQSFQEDHAGWVTLS